ncbi:hypothetical protein GYMLUDRAFT_170760 [Collybiopsis luxurians FD-317 M1]|uniref:Phospholipid/glycerol acyltransferase domain-containing protein n=1 Tax=Collybiopsis luxurians FD-317 M1 TaxID=944289 RepID=A0A0D0BTB1_9AGAR|nr:hypothetical protein GYMLUDRAFT_170760 [Collybiopsis luxurians FD-317 M1]
MLFWNLVVNIFFREIRPRGAYNIPPEGPVIFVGAPHANQMLDPLLLSLQVHKMTGRHVQFLAAAKSLDRRFVGFFSRLMESIPVTRPSDNASPGTGEIDLSETDPCLIFGYGTRFTAEFTPRTRILLDKSAGFASAEVIEVISDTALRIKHEFKAATTDESATDSNTTLLREKVEELQATGQRRGLRFKRLPYINQDEMFQSVYQRLKHGGSIGVFPEGGSHDRTDFLPFKAGVALMALGAMASDPSLQVKIVPVGLSYFHPHRFRSRAVVEFGSAIEVPVELVKMFKQGGETKRAAVSQFLNLTYNALKTVTIRAPDYDTLMLVQAVRRLFKTPYQHLTLGQVVELNRRLLRGYTHFKDEHRVQKLRKDVLKYNRALRNLGIRDHQVPRVQKSTSKIFGLLAYRISLLIVWATFALPGTILNGPIFLLASIISKRKAQADLAASTVKVSGRDVLATWKGLIALGVAPLLYMFYACLASVIALRIGAPLGWVMLVPVGVFIALPVMSFAALKFGEAGVDVLKSLGPLIMALIPGQQRSLERLRNTRERLSNEVMSLIQEFAPRLYDNFEKMQTIPSASSPPSPGAPSPWRRKSSVGAVDGQGLALIHPMTWLDERLFGWSESSADGTNINNNHDNSLLEVEDDYESVISFPSGSQFEDRTRSYARLHRRQLSEDID